MLPPENLEKSKVKPDILLSTYKCRVGSARLEDRASSALKTGKMGRGTLNKIIVGTQNWSPDSQDSPLDPRLQRAFRFRQKGADSSCKLNDERAFYPKWAVYLTHTRYMVVYAITSSHYSFLNFVKKLQYE